MVLLSSYRPLIIASVILLFVSMLLLQVPLFNYLGYEFSAAIALITPLIVWYLSIKIFRPKKGVVVDTTISDYHAGLTTLFLQSVGVLLIPILCATINMLFVKNCTYGEGILFYILIPVVTTIWSIAVASFCIMMFRRRLLMCCIIMVVALCYPLYIGYTSPQIYSYNFIYGYFSGFSYDETLSITSTMMFSRALTVLIALAIVVLTQLVLLRRNSSLSFTALLNAHRSRAALFSFIIIIVFCAWSFRYAIGFESSGEVIRSTLGSQFDTEHFHIIYSRDTFSDEEIRRVAETHEFRFYQVTTALHIDYPATITSFIYPSAEMKRRFIGTGNTNIAKPWRKEIHINKDAWEGTLKHELVHVIAGEVGMPIIKAHYNIGLTEGLATAIDNDFGNRTLDEYAAAMMKFNIVRDPARLIKPVGFAFQASSVSYVMMGSFCQFLIAKYGIAQFKELYGGASVEKAYGVSYEQLVEEWKTTLQHIDVPTIWRKHVEYYFRRPSIFAKECAHAIANQNEEGYRLLEEHHPAQATETFRDALMMSWNTESFGGLARSLFASARYDSVIEMMNAKMRDTLQRTSVANLYLLYGDALWSRHDYLAARNLYQEIVSLDLSERYNESAVIRLTVLQNNELRSALAGFFTGSLNDSSAERLLAQEKSVLNEPIISYLQAKICFRQRKYDRTIGLLESLTTPFDSSILDGGKERLLGESYFMLNDFQTSRAHFSLSLRYITQKSAEQRVSDWIEKCDWFEHNAK